MSMAEELPTLRPLGGPMARRQLHFIWILDVSGSMRADGKIQALVKGRDLHHGHAA